MKNANAIVEMLKVLNALFEICKEKLHVSNFFYLIVIDRCSLRPHPGRCYENETRYYYDERTDHCYEFTYTGCQGNANNFNEKQECESSCVRRRPEPTQRPAVEPRFDGDNICHQPQDYGNCEDNIISYYFNKERNACEGFYYSGCGGNENRFSTIEECERRCDERGTGNFFL